MASTETEAATPCQSRCADCKHAIHDQFKGHSGRWMCFHPYRREISNKGDFTYPYNHEPPIVICKTSASDYNQPEKLAAALAAAKTPVWC